MLNTLNLPCAVCQLYLNKTRKNLSFKAKSEFWKSCTCHNDLKSFPSKKFSDEIGGDINECAL